ncbi:MULTISPECIES: NAD(P)-dependent oxidoreductase [Arthrobacter]|uniref:NAD-dependent epimerase/dehydratase family protein n=1 Tax=Arthrobacter terricola TaxID=2547396 RepID=A0A4R5KDK3_9MICC|nr:MULTISPECIES: NAD(P)H-binding protein [Arthrobacter]MBT8162256.1 NAD(P)H-binding protein [Arthrobacter sp. GN70]TDF92267.1 NAD-dependent epimerase/dehydratase family protein [Arthrobacter terricola]
MKKAVIFGVTGYAGGFIAQELLDRGFEVAGVARSKPETLDPRIAFEAGSIHDLDIVERAVAGADVVVLATRAGMIASDGGTFAQALERILPAIIAQGARLGVVGGAGSLRLAGTDIKHMDRPEFNQAQLPEARLHAEALEVLKKHDDTLDWFYVSPPALFGSYAPGERKGTYRLGKDELLFDEEGNSHISGQDYAIAFVEEIEHPAHGRMRFTVAY